MILGFHWGIAGDGTQALREGNYWYERRARDAKNDQANPEHINRAIAAYQTALQDSLTEEAAAEHLLRAYYFQGCHASPSRDERMKSHTAAKQLGEQMHARYPKNKAIASLYALNLSLWGKEYGPFQAVKEGVGNKVYDLCHLAEDYQIIGRSHQILPYIPIILNWPDKKLVLPNLLKAHKQNPEDLNTYLFLAEYYLEQKQYDEALRWIQTAEDRGTRPKFLLEDRRTRWKLRELKAEVEKKKGK